jgi:hypothetical protein
MGFFFPDVKISQVHGQPESVQIFEDMKIDVLPMYHPAVALYNPGMRETLIKDMQAAKPYISNAVHTDPPAENQANTTPQPDAKKPSVVPVPEQSGSESLF